MNSPIAIAIHGGAGAINREKMSGRVQAAYHTKLQESVEAGYAVLSDGGASADAVVAAITVLEDSPLFNAGHGAVMNHDRQVEHDSSIMVGSTLDAGAIAGISHIRNPIQLAQRVMTESDHVMLIGTGAEEFAVLEGFELVDNEYFHTQRRLDQLIRLEGKIAGSEDESDDFESDKQLGTVGSVAIDRSGVISAGTSTGGMTNKRFGRVGDSPIIGAGTYADENCGISATGHGEYFIRAVVAHEICAMVKHGGVTLAQAADHVVNEQLVKMTADGGVIGIDRHAEISLVFNSLGMYRASVDRDGEILVEIFR
jgi:beta-aspartyl-peptidase (threonine type)